MLAKPKYMHVKGLCKLAQVKYMLAKPKYMHVKGLCKIA